jgi:hypothetical protein
LLQCKHEGGSKYAKKWRNFKADFENELYNAFGNVDVDYTLSIEDGGRIKDVIKTVAEGAKYDIMIIGIIVQDLLVQDSYTGAWSVIPEYPESLDSDLELLAATILSKSNGSMVLAGGPSSFWGFAPKWDNFLAHVRNKLRSSGLQVVPVELADPVFAQMSKESKGFYFANNDEQKEMFVKQWAAWLIAGSSTPDLFRTLTVETTLPSERDRSRSPRRQPAQQFNAAWGAPALDASAAWGAQASAAWGAPASAAAWGAPASAASAAPRSNTEVSMRDLMREAGF